MDSQTEVLFDQYKPLLDAVLNKASEQLVKDDFDRHLLPPLQQFGFYVEEDSFSRAPVLKGRWAEPQGQRRGNVVINDGSAMFELDLLCEHPKRLGRWAEQVSVWGRDPERLRSEINLLEQLA